MGTELSPSPPDWLFSTGFPGGYLPGVSFVLSSPLWIRSSRQVPDGKPLCFAPRSFLLCDHRGVHVTRKQSLTFQHPQLPLQLQLLRVERGVAGRQQVEVGAVPIPPHTVGSAESPWSEPAAAQSPTAAGLAGSHNLGTPVREGGQGRGGGRAEQRQVGAKGNLCPPFHPFTHHVLEGGHRHVRPHGGADSDRVHLCILHTHPQPAGRARALDKVKLNHQLAPWIPTPCASSWIKNSLLRPCNGSHTRLSVKPKLTVASRALMRWPLSLLYYWLLLAP